MPTFSIIVWALIAACAGFGVVGSLYALACRLERDIQEHDLAVRTHRLRGEYARWMEAVRRGEAENMRRPAMLDQPRRAA